LRFIAIRVLPRNRLECSTFLGIRIRHERAVSLRQARQQLLRFERRAASSLRDQTYFMWREISCPWEKPPPARVGGEFLLLHTLCDSACFSAAKLVRFRCSFI